MSQMRHFRHTSASHAATRRTLVDPAPQFRPRLIQERGSGPSPLSDNREFGPPCGAEGAGDITSDTFDVEELK